MAIVPMVNGMTGGATPSIPALGWAAMIGGTVLPSMAGTLLPMPSVLHADPVEMIRLTRADGRSPRASAGLAHRFRRRLI